MLKTKFERWDSMVEQFKRDHPDKIKQYPSADDKRKTKSKGRGRRKADSKGQNQN